MQRPGQLRPKGLALAVWPVWERSETTRRCPTHQSDETSTCRRATRCRERKGTVAPLRLGSEGVARAHRDAGPDARLSGLPVDAGCWDGWRCNGVGRSTPVRRMTGPASGYRPTPLAWPALARAARHARDVHDDNACPRSCLRNRSDTDHAPMAGATRAIRTGRGGPGIDRACPQPGKRSSIGDPAGGPLRNLPVSASTGRRVDAAYWEIMAGYGRPRAG
ncbi:MAG: hypothetical protein FD129_1379 [bacterium]|nr:MAG: hypothetical protein FD129_1379 [bacterium]